MFDPSKLLKKFLKSDLLMEDICKLPNSSFTEVNSQGRSLVGMMVARNLHNEALIRTAIKKGMDVMMPIRKYSKKTLASAICKAGGK